MYFYSFNHIVIIVTWFMRSRELHQSNIYTIIINLSYITQNRYLEKILKEISKCTVEQEVSCLTHRIFCSLNSLFFFGKFMLVFKFDFIIINAHFLISSAKKGSSHLHTLFMHLWALVYVHVPEDTDHFL